MINENCDKYIKRAKYGVLIICFNLLLVFIGKSNYFSSEIMEIFTTVILIILAISFIAITVLINPYLTCLSKYKRF
jgi:Mn2+/Fe2+ NRAMP family transporter